MKKSKIAAAVVLTLALSLGATAYAASNSNLAPETNNACQGTGFGRVTGQRGWEFMTNLLKGQYKVSDEEITNARNSGKTMFDVASDKGVKFEDFKAAMLEERFKAIDAAVEKGTITEAQGKAMKETMNANSANCTTPGQGRGGNGSRMGMGRGAGRGCGMQGGRNFSSN